MSAKHQLDLFALMTTSETVGDGENLGALDWISGYQVDREGVFAYVHLVRAPDDPERPPRPAGGQADRRPHLTLDKSKPEDWREPLRALLADGQARTFNRIGVELLDLTADVLFESPVDRALWELVFDGEVEQTMKAPILFRRRPARPSTCKPCRHGDHYEHHQGVWAKADGNDPVICTCPRCYR
jgi:hypothetical protein